MTTKETSKLFIKAAPQREGSGTATPFCIEFTDWDEGDVRSTSKEVLLMESYIQATALVQAIMGLLPAATFMQFVTILQEKLEADAKKAGLI